MMGCYKLSFLERLSSLQSVLYQRGSLHAYVIYSVPICVSIVWDKIRGNKSKELWLSTNEEEYEDREGNVFNKKTYEDLKRQGLL